MTFQNVFPRERKINARNLRTIGIAQSSPDAPSLTNTVNNQLNNVLPRAISGGKS